MPNKITVILCQHCGQFIESDEYDDHIALSRAEDESNYIDQTIQTILETHLGHLLILFQ